MAISDFRYQICDCNLTIGDVVIDLIGADMMSGFI